jgi:Family of unknown function (DUF5694)
MPRHLTSCGLVLLTCSTIATAAAAQQPAGRSELRAHILVLGTYHFDNPGLDVVKTEVADVLTPAKQAEVKQVIEALARFRPTKIAVEVRADRAARLDSLYAAYRVGRHTLSRSEVQQLGFRLAERFGHPRLYPADHGGEFPFGAVMQYAQAHDPAFVQRVQQAIADMTAEKNRHHQQKSIGEILRLENDPARLRQGHAMYIEGARVGAGDTYVGAELLAKWYERNIRIFSDLQRIAQPGDRVLVIFGTGHAAILRELIASDPRLELIEANEYLPGPA